MTSLLFGNGTDIVHWKPSPETRGTFDILTTCVVTMLLCVWTAVHLNIPSFESTWFERLMRKTGWLVLALIAPELVAYTAWYQRGLAVKLVKRANERYAVANPPSWSERATRKVRNIGIYIKSIFSQRSKKPLRQPTLESQRGPLSQDRYPWTMVHGFYGVMGGFALRESADINQRYLPGSDRGTRCISREGLLYLWDKGYDLDLVPNLSEQDILSKSKANGLAKAIVCAQALWFIAQCLTRLIQHIPISLLELNTFGHAVCAILIYFLWWEKPFEVDYPTMIESKQLWEFHALNFMGTNSTAVTQKFNRDVRARMKGNERWWALSKYGKSHVSRFPMVESDLVDFEPFKGRMTYSKGEQIEYPSKQNSPQASRTSLEKELYPITLQAGQTLQGTGFTILSSKSLTSRLMNRDIFSTRSNLDDMIELYKQSLPNVHLSARDVNRWKMAWRAIQEYVDRHPDSTVVEKWTDRTLRKLFVDRCKDWPNIDDIFDGGRIGLGFAMVAFIYGGLHALAWFAHFHSSVEQLLWRISACIVMGAMPVIVCVFKIADDYVSWDLIDAMAAILMFLVLVAYVLARAHLVVESFISLGHLPAGVYDVPRWTAYIPHI